MPALAEDETSHIHGVYPIFVSFLNKRVTEMIIFTTMTLVCLYYIYILWTTIGKGETSHHTQTQYVHNMIASCFVCKVNANLNPASAPAWCWFSISDPIQRGGNLKLRKFK